MQQPVICCPLLSVWNGPGSAFFIWEALQKPGLRCSYKDSAQAFVKVQISLGNYHASNMRGVCVGGGGGGG